MTVESTISELRSYGVNVSLAGADIRCVAPKGRMTSEKIDFLKSNKEKIIRYLELEKECQAFWEASLESRKNPVDQYPLTSTQYRLWLIDKMDATIAYNMSAALSFYGDLDVGRLTRSLSRMVSRHPILRACVREVENGLLRMTVTVCDVSIPVNHLTIDAVRSYSQSFACRRFDLTSAPLVRFEIIKTKPQQHILLMNWHHIIGDGLSLELFIRELTVLYNNHGREKGLKPDGGLFPFSGYALWHHEALNRGLLQNQLNFWKQRLTNLPPLLPLPVDSPRPKSKTWAGDTKTFMLPPERVQAATRLCVSRQTTLFNLLLAVFYILLKKYSGQDDIPVGIPVANRPDNRLDGTIGCFVNTVVSRVRLDSGMPFKVLMEQVAQRIHEAFAHQEAPFEKVVETLKPERIPGIDPLFQVLFSHQTIDVETIAFSGVNTQVLACRTPTSKFDLAMSFESRGKKIHGMLDYRTDLFESATMEIWVAHYQRILAQVLADPDIRVRDISLFTAQEYKKYACSGRVVPVPEEHLEGGLPGLFEKQVQRTPDDIAVVWGERKWSYAKLNDHANALSQTIIEALSSAPSRIGVCVDRSIEMVVALLATLKSGAAYVPLDPGYAADRLEYMIKDGRLSAIVTTTAIAERLAIDCVPVLMADKTAPAKDRGTNGVLLQRFSPDQPIYMIYTSGSTGKPKGSLVSHKGALNLYDWYHREFGFGPGTRTLLISSLNFDLTQKNIFTPLLNGGCLHLPPSGRFDALALIDTIGREGITSINCTPSTFYALLDNEVELEKLASLRHVFLGGEPLSSKRLSVWTQSPFFNSRIINTYGPTECSDVVAFHRLTPAELRDNAQIPIGYPIDNTQLIVLDDDLNPIPRGAVGELCIAGTGVGHGYYGRPALTAEKFVPNPYDARSGNRLYRSGDQVRVRKDGCIDYLGRIDHQVKIRGHRIELGEIEAVMARLPDIKECVVTAETFDRDEKRLIAYYAPHSFPGPAQAVLRRALEAVLLPHQMPSALVELDALPLNTNGKVDRNALPQVRRQDVITHHAAAPHTPGQQALADLWAKMLGVRTVGINQNFFEAGGDSITATRLVAVLRQKHGLDINVNAIFEYPTIAGFLEKHPLDSARAASTESIPSIDGTKPSVLSFAQHRLWFLQQLSPKSTQYNMCTAIELKGFVDVARLSDSLYSVQVRHAVLRTTFMNGHDGPRQCIHPPRPVDLNQENCQPDAVEEKIAEFSDWIFDLESGPLVVYKLLKIDDAQWCLIVNMHHIISDGWSVDVFMNAVSKHYSSGRDKKISDKAQGGSLQYIDYAQWQRKRLARGNMQARLDFWKGYLNGIPTCHQIPLDFPRPAVQTENGTAEFFAFTTDMSGSIRGMAAKENTSLFVFLLTVFNLVIHKYAGQNDIVIGTPVANRPLPELEELIGLFVNTLVLRNPVSSIQTFRSLLNTVRANTLRVFEHQETPFEMIVDHLKPERNLSHAPLFQLLFVLNTKISEHIELPGLRTRIRQPEIKTAKYDLNVHFIEKHDHLAGYIEYNTDLFRRATIKRLIAYLTQTIRIVLEKPELKIADISIMPEEEHQTTVYRWNQTATVIKTDEPLHRLFEQSCDSHPQRPALYSAVNDQTLSYSALDRIANRFAHYLMRKGVAANVPVAICAPRCMRQIIAQLAVLKASGAFVPLDPDLPDNRKRTIVGEAGCRVMIVTKATDRVKWLPDDDCLVMDDAFDRLLEQMPETRPTKRQSARNLACIFFTSGSTGKPKGILVPHRGLSHDILHLKQKYSVCPSDRSLLLTGFSFDPSIRDLFIALSAGAMGFLMKPEDIKQPGAVLQSIYQQKITHVFSMVPTFLRAMHHYKGHFGPFSGTLKSISLNGEMAYRSDLEKIRDLFGSHVSVVNQYGPTEATMASCSYDATAESARNTTDHLMVGRPYPNTRLYLLDDNLAPVAPGAIGELFIGGIGVTWGYLNRPDLTAAAFIPDPFGADGGRLYKTGDIGRFREDGYLELTGRSDFQIKLRGLRIELNEIEHHLMQYPGIKQGIVKLYRPEQGEPELAAYLVTATGNPLPVEGIRDYLTQQLPAYMAPTIYLFQQTLPTTASGKTDRMALAPPSAQDLMKRQKGTAVISDTEKKIALIWSAVLGHTITGRNSNFFEVGGNSLLLLLVFDKLKQELSPSITVMDLFRHPTITALSDFIDQNGAGDDSRTTQAHDQRAQRILNRKQLLKQRRQSRI